MRKIINFLLTAGLFLAIAALNATPFLSSLHEQIEALALYLVPDEIEQLISVLSEKLA